MLCPGADSTQLVIRLLGPKSSALSLHLALLNNSDLLVHQACSFLTFLKDLTKVDRCLFFITKMIASNMFINFNELFENISALSLLIEAG